MTIPDQETKSQNRVRVVESLSDLCAGAFDLDVNAYTYRRTLTHDFNALARGLAKLAEPRHITDWGYDTLEDLGVELQSPADKATLRAIFSDIDSIAKMNKPGHILPRLRLVQPLSPDNTSMLPADYFHADGHAGDPYFENILCSYNGPSTEYLHNEESLSDAGQRGYYRMKKDAEIKSFGIGNVWRFAILHEDCKALPLIHRAPRLVEPAEPRLLLTVLRAQKAYWDGYSV